MSLRGDVVAGLLVLVGLFVFPGVAPNGYWLFLALQLVIWVFLSISFKLAYSEAGLLSFMQASVFGAGAYSTVLLVNDLHWSLVEAFLGTLIGCSMAGALLGALLFRMGRHSAIIATVLFATVLSLSADALTSVTGGEDGIFLSKTTISLGGLQFATGPSLQMYYLAMSLLTVILLGMLALSHSRIWIALRAIRTNEIRAQTLGYRVYAYRLVAFTCSAGVAGLGGWLYALANGQLTTSVLDLSSSVNAIVWAIVGGVGFVFGPLIGVVIIFPAESIIGAGFTYVDVFIGVMLVLVVLFLRGGVASILERIRLRFTKRTGPPIPVTGSLNLRNSSEALRASPPEP